MITYGITKEVAILTIISFVLLMIGIGIETLYQRGFFYRFSRTYRQYIKAVSGENNERK